MTFPIHGKNKKCSKPPTSYVDCLRNGSSCKGVTHSSIGWKMILPNRNEGF
jgi:hypothetical protein